MQSRNETRNKDGSIECEINHSDLGWLPFTARASDPDPRGARIHAILAARIAGEEEPDVGDDLLQPPSPAELMRRARARAKADKLQLARALRGMKKWTKFKAALAKAGSDAREDWDLAGSISRVDPVFLAIFYHLGMTDVEIDRAFGMRGLA